MNQEQEKQTKESTPIEETKEETSETSLEQHSDALTAAVSQLQQLTAAETQALIQATAQAMGGNNQQQFFSTLDSTNVVLAASIVAAAAASANSTNVNEDERSRDAARVNATNNKRKREATDLSQLPADLLKRELINQKVRADNRERKKRWRQQNEERNKDNDLRCRVNKRAHKLFGKEDNEHKKAWIDDEFRKRQQKRKEKERRKGMIDNSLSSAQSSDLNTLAQHFLPSQQQGQPLPDVNYLTMLCNSLGISGAARALIGNAAAAAFSNQPMSGHEANTIEAKASEAPVENKDEPEHASVKTETEAEAAALPATTPTALTPSSSSQPNPETDSESKDQAKSASSAPLQLIEFLQHLQQYQPQQQNIMESNSSSSELAALPAFPGMDASRPEEKLAALLASTLQAAAAAATAKEDGSERNTSSTPSTSATPAEHTEFPLDAVLTLMQLNAGWRQ